MFVCDWNEKKLTKNSLLIFLVTMKSNANYILIQQLHFILYENVVIWPEHSTRGKLLEKQKVQSSRRHEYAPKVHGIKCNCFDFLLYSRKFGVMLDDTSLFSKTKHSHFKCYRIWLVAENDMLKWACPSHTHPNPPIVVQSRPFAESFTTFIA